MTDKFQEFLGELSDDGVKQEGSTGFTLRSDKAKEKLKEFALARPEQYFLLIIGGLHTLGARNFELAVDSDDLIIKADCEIKRASLEKLWAHVAGGARTDDALGLRLLALAILTSVRFQKATWTIEAVNEGQGFTFRQQVKAGDLPEPEFESEATVLEGCRIWVRRKNLKEVAGRFFRRLKNRFSKQACLEEQLINERLFLGLFESFQINEQFLDCRLRAQKALALLRVGDAPSFLSARHEHRKQGKSSLTVVLTPPDEEADLPGEQGQIHWLWHGLTMGETELNLHSKFARVFVEADGMTTDLSLTAIPDTWARQQVVRNARQAVRDLVEMLVLDFSAKYGDSLSGHDEQIEDIILDVLGERIDISRSRHRLARFNRNLIACPLFTISDEHGQKSRCTLEALWKRVSNNEQIAYFRETEEWEDVPAWPGRPVVVYSRASHARALERIFGGKILVRAGRLLEKLHRFEENGEIEAAEESLSIDPDNPWSGQIEFSGETLFWEWSQRNGRRGRLLVLRDGAPYFMDDELNLPQGFRFISEADWQVDYEGRMADREKADQLPLLAVSCLVDRLSEQDSSTIEAARVSVALWSHLGGNFNRWRKAALRERAWSVVTDQTASTGFSFVSLKEYEQQSPKFDHPRYFLDPEDFENFDWSVCDVTCLILPKAEAEAFGEASGRPLLSALGLKFVSERERFVPKSEEYRTFQYSTLECLKLDARLSEARVSFPLRATSASDEKNSRAWLHTNLKLGPLRRRSFSSFVAPLDVSLDWNSGWPDARGAHFADRGQLADSKTLAAKVVGWAARELLGLPFEEASRVNEVSLGTAWFECWTDSSCEHLPLFWMSDGSRVSPSKIRSTEVVRWYSNGDKNPEEFEEAALWVPEDVVDMLEENQEWLHIQAEPSVDDPADFEEPSIEADKPEEQSAELPVKVEEKMVSLVRACADDEAAEEIAEGERQEAVPESAKSEQSSPPEAKPQRKPVVQKTVSKRSEKAARTKPDSVAKSHKYHKFSQILLSELAEISKLGRVPFLPEFEHFVSRVQWEIEDNKYRLPTGLQISVEEAENLFYGADQSKILILLSALYSLFNRTLEEVEDRHEQSFQKILTKRSLKLFCRSL